MIIGSLYSQSFTGHWSIVQEPGSAPKRVQAEREMLALRGVDPARPADDATDAQVGTAVPTGAVDAWA